MQRNAHPQPGNTLVPFLVSMAEPRLEGDPIPGEYCASAKQWMVVTSEGRKPIIEACGGLAELETKTKVIQEVDDEAINAIMALQTKTFVNEEVDDESQFRRLLELTTKTQAEVEHDDESVPLC